MEKFKKIVTSKNGKNLLYMLVSILLLVQISGRILAIQDDDRPVERLSLEGYETKGELLEGEVIIERFIAEENQIYGFEVVISTYERKNECNVFFEVLQNGELVQEFLIEGKEMRDNSTHFLYFDVPLENVKNKEFTLEIRSDASEKSNAVTFWEESTNGELLFHVISENHEVPMYLIVVIMSGIGGCLLIGYIFFVLKKLCFEKAATCVIFLIGIIYVTIMTPYSGPDEGHHYEASYILSNVLLQKGGNKYEIEAGESEFGYIGYHTNEAEWYTIIEENGFFEKGGETRPMSGLKNIYPVWYVPQMLGVSIGRLVQMNQLGLVFMGRFFNLLMFSIVMYFSMKIIPRFKTTIFLVSMFPMTIQQAASFSYDATINALSVLLIALILRSVAKIGIMNKKEKLQIGVVTLLLAPCKVLYTAVSIFFLAIPKERFKNNKDKWLTMGLIIGGSIMAILAIQLSAVTSIMESGGASLNNEGHLNYTVGYILENPISTIRIFLGTIIDQWTYYYSSLVGKYLSGTTISISMIWIHATLLLFALSTIGKRNESIRVSKEGRVFLIISIVAIFFATLLTMFLAWTSDYRTVIQGVQGRYFIPLMLPLALVVSSNFLDKNRFEKYLPAMMVGIQIQVIYEILYTTIVS